MWCVRISVTRMLEYPRDHDHGHGLGAGFGRFFPSSSRRSAMWEGLYWLTVFLASGPVHPVESPTRSR